ncbi:MAG TPA: hypothetical protein VN437_03640, partial [Rectinemataceae bacterium]|nr:hypothetical protein [Rectinemataceae bacterium]
LVFKGFNRSFKLDNSSFFAFNFVSYFVVVCTYLAIGGKIPPLLPITLAFGVAFGIVFVTIVYCYMKAMETGPLSFSVLALSFGIVLPILYGSIFWGESIQAIQVVGLFLLFATFFLFAGSLKIAPFPGRKLWIAFCLLTFAGNGIGMILVKSHQMISGGKQVRELLLVAFATSALVCLCMLGVSLFRKGKISNLFKANFVALAFGAGITTALGNYFSVYLNSRMPGIIQFPVSNGGVALASTVMSWIIFKEKINRRGLLGLATGIVALVLLSLN